MGIYATIPEDKGWIHLQSLNQLPGLQPMPSPLSSSSLKLYPLSKVSRGFDDHMQAADFPPVSALGTELLLCSFVWAAVYKTLSPGCP